ncbi:LysR family transcriptional regulator [Denitrobaculum tricleocarpae]|uniref:LysR family transcriptional regulator n=1 Tax=Denitrobaculum tricleocarpae TaxID=2591009 RepID=A0A545TY23_9PROT|nr:LysR family transcriptional regulator [Denitrobaculum tricleocarpae]TQV82128.1 LysR family transcriptional regulator [Denitrobaculum tricleocarpae]
MQKKPLVSLNAVRVFEVAARNGSLKSAAEELSVTPSAVSHQIKSLEAGLGVVLFERRNNAVVLSDAGRQFLDDVSPPLRTIERAADALLRSASEVVVRLSVSLAVRWLIPRLESFKKRHPTISIRLETTHNAQVPLSPDVDLAITYNRNPAIDAEETPAPLTSRGPSKDAVLLMSESCRPVLSPVLLARSGYRRLADIGSIPVLSATQDDWDWSLWSRSFARGVPEEIQERPRSTPKTSGIRVVDRFDTDDAAIHGAVAGMGMVLMPPVMTEREVEAGSLVELPAAPSAVLGAYELLTTARPRPVVEKFHSWLLKQRPAQGE